MCNESTEIINLDAELELICKSHGLSLNNLGKKYEQFVEALRKIWKNIPDDTPIAFYGAGSVFKRMSKILDIDSKNVVCIIENNMSKRSETSRFPIINFKEIGKYNPLKIILTGTHTRKEMKDEIREHDPSIEVIDIHEIMQKQGLHNKKNLFDTGKYIDLEYLRKTYTEANTQDLAQKALKKLIGGYLECRDFVCAKFFINEYINRKFHDYETFASLIDELDTFLDKIRCTIKSRCNANVIVYVLDSLSLEYSKNDDFFAELSGKGLSFTKAYAPSSIYTRQSTYGFFMGVPYVEGGLYKVSSINRQNSKFLNEMYKTKVKVKHISSQYFVFLEDVHVNSACNMLSFLNWQLLIELAKGTDKTIFFVHGIETHGPYHSGNPSVELYEAEKFSRYLYHPNEAPKGYFDNLETLRKEALIYASDQLKFCLSLCDFERDSCIITADHHEKKYPCAEEDMHRVPLIILSKPLKSRVYDDVYSTVDMANIIKQLLTGEKELKLTKHEYARQEVEPLYAASLMNAVFLTYPQKCGEICLTTNTERYVFYLNGHEEYYLHSDLTTNLISDKRYRNRIDYFRSQINVDTREVWKYMFERFPLMKDFHGAKVDEYIREDKNPRRLIGSEGV